MDHLLSKESARKGEMNHSNRQHCSLNHRVRRRSFFDNRELEIKENYNSYIEIGALAFPAGVPLKRGKVSC